ncbi:MAG: glycosyltransferase family 39 protein [Propionibacterium sp.]|nr:glycosyltransferase family 39 protein [Propionibacterium sp.]
MTTSPTTASSAISGLRLPDRVRPFAIPGLLFILAAWWFLDSISQPGVQTDEGVTLVVIHRSLPQLLRLWHGNDATLVPYYLLAKTVRRLAIASGLPVSDLTLIRSLSAVAMALACAILYALVRRRADARIALAATVALTFMPGTLRWAQQARPYSLMVLASAASWLMWDKAREEGGWRSTLLYAMTVVVGSVIHLFLLLQYAAQFAVALVHDRLENGLLSRRFTAARTIGGSLAIAAVAAWYPVVHMLQRGHGVPSHSAVPFSHLTATALQTITSREGPQQVGPVVVVLVVAGLVTLVRARSQHAVTFALWLALSFALQSAAAYRQPGTLRLRYWMALSSPLGLLVGIGVYGLAAFACWSVSSTVLRGVSREQIGWLRTAFAAAAVATLVALTLPANNVVRSPAGHGTVADTRGVFDLLRSTPHNPLLLVDSQFNIFAFAGYGVKYVYDNPYSQVQPDSAYAWSSPRRPTAFRRALAGHMYVVLAQTSKPQAVTRTMQQVQGELVHAGYALVRTTQRGPWAVLLYRRR